MDMKSSEYDMHEEFDEEYYQRREAARKRRIAQIKKQQLIKRRIFMVAVSVIIIALIVLVIVAIVGSVKKKKENSIKGESISEISDVDSEIIGIEDGLESGTDENSGEQAANQGTENTLPDNLYPTGGLSDDLDISHEASIIYPTRRYEFTKSDYNYSSESYAYLENDEFLSTYGILINWTDKKVIAGKDAYTQMNPASMTKILTVLTARQYISDGELDSQVEITQEAVDYSWIHGCSSVGFEPGELVTVRDLFYGTILQSGGEAAYTLAQYVAGDMEVFVELMNLNLQALGISDTTHFTNCVGIYNENHYSTCHDIAVILDAAMHTDDFLTELMGARKYTTSLTTEHPEGIDISNWFLRRIEDKETYGYVSGAKTGFVNQSGNCAASYMNGDDGKDYICVTGNAWSVWRCIYDHVCAYNVFAMGNKDYTRG